MQTKTIRVSYKFTVTLLPFLFWFIIAKYISLSIEPQWSNPVNIIEINSDKDDFAPQWNQFEGRLYFSSNRKGKSKFYVSEFNQFQKFSLPKELEDPINKATRNVSYIRFINETEAILNAFRRGKIQAYINIFYSQRIANQWQKPIPLDSLQCECFVLHPTISPDGTFMVFSSDMELKGQLDLYIAYKKDNGIWGNIEKLEDISTDGDEITPFLAANDTLYFASNGFGGPGGFDLFYSVRKENYWDKPIPLNQINSRFDESDFAVINDTLAIFASNRPEGLGGLDLYLTTRTFPKEILSESELKFDLSLSVQISVVRVQQEFSYELALFPQIVPYSFLTKNTFFDSIATNTIPSIDILKQNYISILFARIANLNTYTVLAYDTTNPEIHSIILNTIENFESFNSKLKELIKIEHTQNDFLLIKSENQSLFEPIKIGKLNEYYEPPVLELSINARPEKFLSNFEFSIRNTRIKGSGTKVPLFTTIELNSDSLLQIRNSDTLFIDLVAVDIFGQKHQTSYPIILNRSFVQYRNSLIFTGKKYDRIYLPSFLKLIENRIDFAKLTDELPQFSDNVSNCIIIGKFETNPKELVTKLSSLLGIAPNRISFSITQTEYERVFGKIPTDFIVLLVERL